MRIHATFAAGGGEIVVQQFGERNRTVGVVFEDLGGDGRMEAKILGGSRGHTKEASENNQAPFSVAKSHGTIIGQRRPESTSISGNETLHEQTVLDATQKYPPALSCL